MIKYKNFQPTQFDSKGAFLPDRQEWYVAPVTKVEDTDDCLMTSNWDAFLKAIGGESKSVEIHLFGHWAHAFNIILISPKAKSKIKIASRIELELEDYPVIDEELWSQYESEQQWENCKLANRELTRELEEYFNIEDLDLTEDCLSYMCADGWIEFRDNYPHLDLEHTYSKDNKYFQLSYLIEHGCEFTFTEDTDLSSNTNPDLLKACLFKALAGAALKGKKYFDTQGVEIEIPSWAYPNENQITLKLA